MGNDSARDYQIVAIDKIREEFANGHRKVLLHLATGAGKTFVFCRMVQQAVARGKKCIVVVKGRKLVDQASERLFREKVLHGTFMANHWNFRPVMPTQVCSIDTVLSRAHFPEADLIVVDEAHLAMSEGYKQFLDAYPNAFIVAVTATPYVGKSLRHLADAIVHPITMLELIQRGFLVPFRYYAPSVPDLSGVEISKSTKDYKEDQLANVMESNQLTGKIIEHWLAIANGLPTIGFAVNVHHSKLMVAKFLASGIAAEHVDASSSDTHRAEVIARLISGETKIVWNVGILCTGVDIPPLRAVIMARPTTSRNLFIQIAGRGTRLFEGKSDCILLDHAGNIERHGLPTDEEDVDLDGKPINDNYKAKTKICKECFAAFRGPLCPECGVAPPERDYSGEVGESEGQLVELTQEHQDMLTFKSLLKEARKTKKKKAWAYHRIVERIGLERARPFIPDWVLAEYQKTANQIFGRSLSLGRSVPKNLLKP